MTALRLPAVPWTPAMAGPPRLGRRADWRRLWPLPVSLAVHAAVGATLWTAAPVAPPPPLPQIELVAPPPAPVPEEAPAPPEPAPAEAQPAQPAPPPPRAPAVRSERAAPHKPLKHPSPLPAETARPPAEPVPLTAAGPSETSAATAAASPPAERTPAAAASPAASGPPPDYVGQVRARLEKVKRYPAEARRAGQEGSVLLDFTLDREGEVTAWTISRGSGVDSLDAEVGEMIRRASFPPFPESLPQASLHLAVPVAFSLKTR